MLCPFLADVLKYNGLEDGTYVEPYAGGAGAALGLLFGEHVRRLVLNDADECVYRFWKAALTQNEMLKRRVETTPVTMGEWHRQREIYTHPLRHSNIKVAFASLFLNRCNRSGIMVNGGPIGGYDQKGQWKLDARYSREGLALRLERIATYKDRISFFGMDALEFLDEVVLPTADPAGTFLYLDPPYYAKGGLLYLNHYEHADHEKLADYLRELTAFRWLLSYDDVPEIRELYAGFPMMQYELSYSAHTRRTGTEILIWNPALAVPHT